MEWLSLGVQLLFLVVGLVLWQKHRRQKDVDTQVLKTEVGRIFELNLRLSQEVHSLKQALQGDIRSQGAWGELILDHVLEKSGLRKDEDYALQLVLQNKSGEKIRPDALIFLPENKCLVVDSKVSLTHYFDWIKCEEADGKAKCLKNLAESMRRHIDQLSQKTYFDLHEFSSPEFVFLFVPLESLFSLMITEFGDLWDDAWKRRVIIVSPTNLMTSLKTVAFLWRHEKQERNALAIAERGGLLYDKFAGFVDDLKLLKERISQVEKVAQSLDTRLHEGPGNLLSQVEKLKELGAKTQKNLRIPTQV